MWRSPEKEGNEHSEGKKNVPSDIRELHCLGKHVLPTRVGPVSAPPSGVSAAVFDQVPGGTCPCPWRLPLLSKGAVLLRGSPVKPADLNIEATCRPGAAPPMAASEYPRSPPSPEGSGRSGAPLRRSPLNRSRPARNSPARHWPPPLFQDRNPGAGSTGRDRRRLGANLRLPLGTRKILRLSQTRATRKFSKKLGHFLVDFGCKILSIIATSLMVHTATIYPHLVHMPLKTSQKPHPRIFLGSTFSSVNYADLVVYKSAFFFLDP